MSDHRHASHPAIVKRLKRAEGHLRSVVAMIEGGRPCLDIAQQLHAVEKAVAQAKRTLIHDHLDHCLDETVGPAVAGKARFGRRVQGNREVPVMLAVLANRTYRHLFAAQVIALLGTGLLTVALGLLAFELAGANAGAVLGTALAIKMIAYVGVAPIASAFAERVPRRAMLVALDLVRAGVALFLPFVTEVWQIYVLIFVLQSASAAFTPTFQATIPDVLPDEKDYTRALSLSRLAYDLESLVSPMLAAALLTVISYHNLFAGTVVGFLVSAALVVSVVAAEPEAVAAARHLRPHDARHPHLSRDAAPARAAGDQHGGRGGWRAGDRQHRRLRAGRVRPRPERHGAGAGSLRRRLHAGRAGPAAASGSHPRPHRDACRRVGPCSRDADCRRDPILWLAAAALVRHRGGLFDGADAVRTAPAPLLASPRTARRCSPPSSRCRMPAGCSPIRSRAGQARRSGFRRRRSSWR